MRRLSFQRGLGMVTAIFLLVVLTALGAAMVQVMSVSHQAGALDIRGARAYQAARAGAEWGAWRVRRELLNTCPTSPTTFALPDGEGGFVVTVQCTMVSHVASTSKTIRRFRVIATACSPSTVGAGCPNATNSTDYVQRVVDIRFGD
jgi:MSHA biogenesis protein MshP